MINKTEVLEQLESKLWALTCQYEGVDPDSVQLVEITEGNPYSGKYDMVCRQLREVKANG